MEGWNRPRRRFLEWVYDGARTPRSATWTSISRLDRPLRCLPRRSITDFACQLTWRVTERAFQRKFSGASFPFADPPEADLHWMQDDVSVARRLPTCCSALKGRANEQRDLPIMTTRSDAGLPCRRAAHVD